MKRVELVGAAEIRVMLGNVSRQRVNVVINSKGFPDPYQTLVMGKVWDKQDVARWLAENRPNLLETKREGISTLRVLFLPGDYLVRQRPTRASCFQRVYNSRHGRDRARTGCPAVHPAADRHP
ncbi:hypothetical protein FF096_07130 [Micromonospora sp. CP22]|nr:hypothetical protein [Micromonospora sp. CP22]